MTAQLPAVLGRLQLPHSSLCLSLPQLLLPLGLVVCSLLLPCTEGKGGHNQLEFQGCFALGCLAGPLCVSAVEVWKPWEELAALRDACM